VRVVVVVVVGLRQSVRVRRGRWNMTCVHHLPYFLVLVVQRVSQLRLFEARGRHPLVHGVGWRVRRVQTRLNEGLSCFRSDHRLKLPSGKSIYMARFTGHQQHHLGARQCRQFVSLFHDSRLSFRECRVSPEFVVDELHFDFDSSFGFLAVGRRGLLVGRPVLAAERAVVHVAVSQTDRRHGDLPDHGILFEIETGHVGRSLLLMVSGRVESHPVVGGTQTGASVATDMLVLVLQNIDVRIGSVTVQISTGVASQGTVGITHRVPRFGYTTSLTLHCRNIIVGSNSYIIISKQGAK